ncbi:MAG: dipicolinate synthase subunit B [Clostridiales bacterium]|nr:dipicolinate synthase subunit B [Clostridiales bacterium]
MDLAGLKVGFCICGSFCTFETIIPEIKKLVIKGANVVPVFSKPAYSWDTRFFSASEFRTIIESITGENIVHSIIDAERFGPDNKMDIMVVAPCTGNTMAKLANGITDSAVTMACKAHLRNNNPVVLAIATNDGLGANARNIGALLNRKNFYFVPFGQDEPCTKSNSLVAKFEMLLSTMAEAVNGRQIQPLLI